MRAVAAILLILVSALPVAAANHPGCSPDPSVDAMFVGVSCDSYAHHTGTMYDKRVWIEIDAGTPYDFRLEFQHKYSTAAHASTCRIVFDSASMTDTSIGTPCAGGHDPLLP